MRKCELHSNFIEITLPYVCYLVNLLHIYKTPFSKNNSKGKLLKYSMPRALGKAKYYVHIEHQRCSVKKVFLEIS